MVKISTKEPADRLFKMELSHAEVIALVNWHTAQVKNTTKRFGAAAMEMQKFNVIPNGKNLKSLHTLAKEQIESHAARGRELIGIIKIQNCNQQQPTK